MYLNIPVLLTLLRFVITPFLIITFYLPYNWSSIACSLMFLIASITDFFDGFLARKWNKISYIGTLLDPIADKTIISIALLLILEYFHTWWITLPTAGIIMREMIISTIRGWIIKTNKHNHLSVSMIGKTKTTIQMISLITLLSQPTNKIIINIGVTTLYISTILAIWSMLKYLNEAKIKII